MSTTRDFSEFAAHLREFIRADRRRRDGCPSEELPGGEEFQALALRLFALQFEAIETYRRFCESRGATPGTVARWEEIPAVPTRGFKEFDLTSLKQPDRAAVFHSSGTTGHRPSRHFHSRESLSLYEDSVWEWFREHLLGDFAVNEPPEAPGAGQTPPGACSAAQKVNLLILAPGPAEAPHSSLVHMFETVRTRLDQPESAFVGTLNANGDWSIHFARAFERLQAAQANPRVDVAGQGNSGQTQIRAPLLILGTAFSFLELLETMGKRKMAVKLPPGSRLMETGGYKGRSRTLPKAELHGLLSRRLGIPLGQIVCEYGMSEASSQAYDRRAALSATTTNPSRVFRFPPWARARLVSPETGRGVAEGETGLIQIFDLANVFSVMALQTEDLGLKKGAGFKLIGRAESSEPRGCSLLSQ